MATSGGHKPRGLSTICLPFRPELYERVIGSPAEFRKALDQSFRDSPELFPDGFEKGYRLKDSRTSTKRGIRLRRIRLKASGAVFTVRPSFLLPYMAGFTDDAEKALFLRRFAVPFWAIARGFGRNPMYWYRVEVGLGRNSVAGTTLRRADLPADLVADEHHQTRDGAKVYVATVVAGGCCLGAEVVDSCDEEALTAGYAAFREEVRDIDPAYTPRSVCTDGWEATRLAWAALFPLAALIRCFLHGWLKIRDGCRKHPLFVKLSGKVWEAYHAPSRRSFGQRLRRLREWAEEVLAGEILTRAVRLCGRGREYGEAYAHPGCHRTSVALDRVMRGMSGYFDGCGHLHGSNEASRLHGRAWALLVNFAPWGPEAVRADGEWRSPAERVNGHRYHDNWLHNLLVSASLAGYRHRNGPPHNP
jgi:hypothetical protein